jgi:hypothetical protein
MIEDQEGGAGTLVIAVDDDLDGLAKGPPAHIRHLDGKLDGFFDQVRQCGPGQCHSRQDKRQYLLGAGYTSVTILGLPHGALYRPGQFAEGFR